MRRIMFRILLDTTLDFYTLFPYLDLGPISLCLTHYGIYKTLNEIKADKKWQAKLSFEIACLIFNSLANPNWSFALQLCRMLDFVYHSLKEMVTLTHTVQLIQRHSQKKRH